MTKRRRRSNRPLRIMIPSEEIAVMEECGCCIRFERNKNYKREYKNYLEKLKTFQGENI